MKILNDTLSVPDHQLLLVALRAYLDGRHQRFAVDHELMDSAGKCAMFLEINDRLVKLEQAANQNRWAQKKPILAVVDDYGRLLFEYRARRNARHAAEDLEHIRYIYELYDRCNGYAGQYMEMHGCLGELNRAFNIMSSLGIQFHIRPVIDQLDPDHCDWMICCQPHDYQRYTYHLTVTGNGFDRQD